MCATACVKMTNENVFFFSTERMLSFQAIIKGLTHRENSECDSNTRTPIIMQAKRRFLKKLINTLKGVTLGLAKKLKKDDKLTFNLM